jgi:hypothetical protein
MKKTYQLEAFSEEWLFQGFGLIAFGAYFVTIGLMYSPNLFFGKSCGPIWLPMLSLIPGLAIGFIIRSMLLKFI